MSAPGQGGFGGTVAGTVRRVDRWQQDTGPAGFAYAVIKKYGDDRGGMLAGLIAFYGFLSLFPLLLVAVTVLGYVLGGDPSLHQRVLNSAFGELPIVGRQLRSQVEPLRGSGLGLLLGLLGLLWGSMGIAQAVQYAMQQAWAVPNLERPGFGPRLLRSLAFLGVVGAGVIAGAGLAGFASFGNHVPVWPVVTIVLSAGVNIAMFLLGYKVVGPGTLQWRDLVPGAVIAGLGWTALQALGGYFLGHQLRHSSQVYGTFAVVLGFISFLSIGAQLSVYAAEINVVRARRLWPRSIVQPPLTDPDREVLVNLVRQEQRRDDQHVSVSFDKEKRPPA